MNKHLLMFAAATLFCGAFGLTFVSTSNGAHPPESFTKAHVHFEQNATDEDVEVVFEVKGGAEGLAKLTVVSPDGRAVVDFNAPDASTLGMRQFRFESPEPKDVNGLKAAYPEGVYTFAGETASGIKFLGKSTLNHTLPATTSFVHPKAQAESVPVKNLVISWTPVENIAAYLIYIEQDELQVEFSARLAGTVSQLAVPDGFLVPGTQYTLGLGTVTEDGNVSIIETWFTTAKTN